MVTLLLPEAGVRVSLADRFKPALRDRVVVPSRDELNTQPQKWRLVSIRWWAYGLNVLSFHDLQGTHTHIKESVQS